MAGTVIVTDSLCWIAPNWIHDNVLEILGEIVGPDEPLLASMLLNSRTYYGGYLDLRPLDKATMLKLVDATENAQMKLAKDGAESFYDPGAYPGFMQQIGDLKEC